MIITNPSSGQTHQKDPLQRRVLFDNIAAAEWVVSVETDTLLSRLEQYGSREGNKDSPVQAWTKEQTDCCGKHKAYYHVTVGDLRQTDDVSVLDGIETQDFPGGLYAVMCQNITDFS